MGKKFARNRGVLSTDGWKRRNKKAREKRGRNWNTTERIRGSAIGWRHKPYLYPRVFQAYKNGAVIRGTPRLKRVRMRAEIRGYTRACTRPCLRLNTHRSTSYTGWIASCRQAALSGYEILENLRAHATQSIPSTYTYHGIHSVKHAIGMR